MEAKMFYCNLEHTAKKAIKTRSGKVKNAPTAKSRFHYISRTLHFKKYKESASEQIEFVRSGNMPNFAEGKPAEFWNAAEIYERSNGRTCSSLVVALPKELTVAQRIELAEAFIAEFADRYRYPFTCAIHNHAGALAGQEQPHFHFMYSERHVDGIERTAEQFFKRYNAQDPQKGGAQKLTADVLGMGKAQLQLYRKKTEELINDSLERYAPTKMVEIRGIPVEVPSFVSCLSNKDYNKKYGTQLKDAPIMNKAVRFAQEDEPELFAKKLEMTAEINHIRAENYYELYKPYYEQALNKQHQLAREKSKEEEKQLQQNQEPSNDYDRGPGFG
ncbi:Mobilization protein A [compost metagenome]